MHPILRLSVLPLAVTLLVPLAAVADAHVSIQPGTAEKGAYTAVAVRVPTERDAATVKVQVSLPTDHPVKSVRVKPHAGWTVAVTRSPAPDASTPGAVTSLTWTATAGGIPKDQFDEFEISLGPLPKDADQLVFPAVQTYADGEVVNWTEPVVGDAEPEHPAPTLTLVDPAATSVVEPAALDAVSSSSADDGPDGLAVAGLVVACLALATAVGGVALSRRRTAAG